MNKRTEGGMFHDPTGANQNDEEYSLYMNIYNKLLNDKNKRNPSVKKNWGTDEVKLLEYAVRTYLKKKKHGEDKLTTHDWKEIANFIPGRTESQCLYKWNLTKHKVSFRKSTWQGSEDKILKELVKKHGKKHWQKIANELNERMGGSSQRAGKQCRERWLNHLDDKIRKDPWTNEEDLLLLQKQKLTGNRWSDIVKYLPGRTENMVKNRFNTLAKQKREEKRNSSVKQLDDIIGGLEEKKEVPEDKNAWIDEKINELENEIIKHNNDPREINIEQLEKGERPTMEEKRKTKVKESREKIEEPRKEKANYNYTNPENNLFERYDQREDLKTFLDTTPQQNLRHPRREFDTQGYLSPYGGFPQRQLPPSSNRMNVFGNNREGSPNVATLNEVSKNLRSGNKLTPYTQNQETKEKFEGWSKNIISSPNVSNLFPKIQRLMDIPNGGIYEAQKLESILSILDSFMNMDSYLQKNEIENIKTKLEERRAPKPKKDVSILLQFFSLNTDNKFLVSLFQLIKYSLITELNSRSTTTR